MTVVGNSIADLVGKTPLVKVESTDRCRRCGCLFEIRVF